MGIRLAIAKKLAPIKPPEIHEEGIWLDTYFFKWVKETLADATPDQIAAFYVEKLVFHNEGYLEYLQAKYKLPNDILRLHAKIIKLANES